MMIGETRTRAREKVLERGLNWLERAFFAGFSTHPHPFDAANATRALMVMGPLPTHTISPQFTHTISPQILSLSSPDPSPKRLFQTRDLPGGNMPELVGVKSSGEKWDVISLSCDMEYLTMVYAVMVVVVGARGIHAAYLNGGGVIWARDKDWIGLVEFGVLLLWMILDRRGGSVADCFALGLLFAGFRWLSDYVLNRLRGLDWHYMPSGEQRETLAWTDALLLRWGARERLWIRLGFWVVCIVSSLIISSHA